MFKQSPTRSLKSKGVKVKHVLQVCVLIAICFWLLYQVKHSEEKSRAFDAKDENIVKNLEMDGEILRFGRKDLPRFTEIGTSGKELGEDDVEKESEEEEIKLKEEENNGEKEEPEREDRSIEETNEERGGGDDETDENELEKKEAETEHGEEDNEEDVEENHAENVEEEFGGNGEERVEADEGDGAQKEDRSDLKESQEVNEGGDRENADAHEAREEQYKADDASSEVGQHVRSVIPETENVTLNHVTDIFGETDIGQESEIRSTDNHDEMSTNSSQNINVNKEKLVNDKMGGYDEKSSSRTYDEDGGEIQNDPIDTFDTNVAEEEEEFKVDMDTQQDIKMEGQISEEVMAE